MGGKTNKVKIQTYVSDEIHAYFESEALTLKVTESKLVEQILAERYGLAANLRTDSAVNPAITDRLKYLEDKLLQVIRVYEETSAYLDSRVTQLENLNAKVDESADKLALSELDDIDKRKILPLERISILEERFIKLRCAYDGLKSQLEGYSESYTEKIVGLYEHIRLLESAANPKAESALIQESLAEMVDTMLDTKLAKLKEQSARLELLLDSKLEKARESMGRLATSFNASEVKITYSTDKGLSQRELAKRLGCCVKGLMQRRDRPEELLAWIRERDPEHLCWEYREGRYYVV